MNILRTTLEPCGFDPVTGYKRDGYCSYSATDPGAHLVCAKVTREFLEFTKKQGNDLTRIVKPGDRWCLCVGRWIQAYKAGVAPPIIFEATNSRVAQIVPLSILMAHRAR